MIYINCLLITVIFVIVSDLLHFWDNFSPIISRALTKGKITKPIPSKLMTCSTCQSWWANLIYIIIVGKVSIPMIAYILILAYFATFINDVLAFTLDLLKKIINNLSNLID